jgi:hypothetical protein
MGFITQILDQHGMTYQEAKNPKPDWVEPDIIITEVDKNCVTTAEIAQPKNDNLNEKYYIPSREELDAELEAAREADEKSFLEDLKHKQNNHEARCGTCLKFHKETTNIRSKMGRCSYYNLMVLEYQTPCDVYRFNKNHDIHPLIGKIE